MSNLQDLPGCSKTLKEAPVLEKRTVDRVQDICEDIKRTLNSIKCDVGCIKSDLSMIKQAIKDKQQQEDAILKNQVKKQEALSKGWFFTY